MRKSNAVVKKPVYTITADELCELALVKVNLHKAEKRYEELRAKVIAVAEQSGQNVIRRAEFVATIKEQLQRRPDYKRALTALRGEDYIQRLIDETEPLVVKKVDVIEISAVK